jgi:putative ABC transport system permease protein
MKLLLKISWRNVWRNPKRSLVMIIAITAGLWGGIFAGSLSFGLMEQRFKTSIEQHISHLQMHHPGFLVDQNVKNGISEWPEIRETLSNDHAVSAFTGRTMLNGMLASANLTVGINIIGIDPAAESATTGLDKNIVEGGFFDEEIRNPVLVGKKLAEKTKIRERSRIVLTFQDVEGELVSATFRVAGIFRTANSGFDERNVYLLQTGLAGYVGGEAIINEIAVAVKEIDEVHEVAGVYREKFPEITIRTWNEVSPELGFMMEMVSSMLMFVLVIILFALAFGLVNTMLMSVFERVRELGVLMAVGMNKRRVFLMVMFETVFLTLLGAKGGVLMGYGTMAFFGRRGMDLAVVGGDSLNEFGFPSTVYPTLEGSFFVMLALLVIITALATAIYPSLRALKLNPAEAVRKE